MKKILLTTSALTLIAGAAAADMSVSGYGRIGFSSTDGTSKQYTRMQTTFSGTSTSDSGLTFNAQTRYESTGNAKNEGATGVFAAPTFSISNGSMSLNLGNTAGAISANAGIWGCGAVMWGCGDMADSGFTGQWATRQATGAGMNPVRLDMALGGASVSVSGGNGNDTELAVSMPMGGGSVGVGYDTDASTDGNPVTQINYSGSMSGMGVGVKLLQQNAVSAYMASVSVPVGAGSVYVHAGKTIAKKNNYGIRYNQSLGGGASMQVGATNAAGDTTVGAAVHFGF